MACLVTTDRAKFDLKTTVLKQHSWNCVQALNIAIISGIVCYLFVRTFVIKG